MKELSIIIPTKDRPGLLSRALRALGNSAIGLEIFVVDDGSTPENASQNRSVCRASDNCDYVCFSRSRGAPTARNHGLAASRGAYVWFMDDDDYASPRTVDDVLQSIRTCPAPNEVLLLPRSRILDGTRIHLDIPAEEANKFERHRRFGIEVTTSCAVFSRDVISKIGGWDESLCALQDADLFLRAAGVAVFRCLKTEPVCVDVGHATRITFSFSKSQLGKLQFLRKHWRILPARRKLRLALSVVFCAPLTRKLRLRRRLAAVRARA